MNDDIIIITQIFNVHKITHKFKYKLQNPKNESDARI